MEKQKGSYVISAIALCMAVVALAVGFSTFSNTATITTNATVNPENDFKVELSSSSTGTTTTAVSASSNVTGATGSGTLTAWNNGTSTINLSGTFTNTGQELTYVFYARNTGDLKAFLNDISYNGQISCNTTGIADNQKGDATMIENACKTMTLSMEVDAGNSIKDTLEVDYNDTSKKATISNQHPLAATTGFDTITVKVKYNGNSNPEQNYGKVDGSFNVQFGTITLSYASTDNRSA